MLSRPRPRRGARGHRKPAAAWAPDRCTQCWPRSFRGKRESSGGRGRIGKSCPGYSWAWTEGHSRQRGFTGHARSGELWLHQVAAGLGGARPAGQIGGQSRWGWGRCCCGRLKSMKLPRGEAAFVSMSLAAERKELERQEESWETGVSQAIQARGDGGLTAGRGAASNHMKGARALSPVSMVTSRKGGRLTFKLEVLRGSLLSAVCLCIFCTERLAGSQ